jgi:hypothetical protein
MLDIYLPIVQKNTGTIVVVGYSKMFEFLILQPSRVAATAETLTSRYASNSREANKSREGNNSKEASNSRDARNVGITISRRELNSSRTGIDTTAEKSREITTAISIHQQQV